MILLNRIIFHISVVAILGLMIYGALTVHAQTVDDSAVDTSIAAPVQYMYPMAHITKPTPKSRADYRYKVITPFSNFNIVSFEPDNSIVGCIDIDDNASILCGSYQIIPVAL